jgi:hypothetical protein
MRFPISKMERPKLKASDFIASANGMCLLFFQNFNLKGSKYYLVPPSFL